MRKQILSVCLSLAILAASGATYGMQASATETAAEGASVIEAVPAAAAPPSSQTDGTMRQNRVPDTDICEKGHPWELYLRLSC